MKRHNKKILNQIVTFILIITIIFCESSVGLLADTISNNSIQSLIDTTTNMDEDENVSNNINIIEENDISDSNYNDMVLESTEDHTNSDGLDIESDNIEIEGTDSFGELFADSIETDTKDIDTGYSVFSVKINDNVATVNYTAVDEAKLVVGIYEENGNKLLATGITLVSGNLDVCDVTIDTDFMPQYFYVKAYLIETETLRPLCRVYECPNYTKEMQEFLSKTVDDFQIDRIYNLDSSDTNNFAVYNDDILVKDDKTENNTVKFMDKEEQKYIIENADEDVKALTIGDIYAYETENGLLIIKISSIEVEDTTVTIFGTETSLEEVFDYIKIDTTMGMEEAVFDDSEADACVTYKGVGERKDYSDIIISENSLEDEICAEKIEGDIKTGDEFKFDLFDEEMIEGSVGFDIEVGLTYYLIPTYRSVELFFQVNGSFEVKVSSDLDKFKTKIGKVKLPAVNGIRVALVVYFKMNAEVAITLEGGFKSKFGLSYNSDTGVKEIKELKPYIEVRIDGSVSIGLEFDPQVEILDENICFIGGTVDTGIKISGSSVLFEENKSDTERHNCSLCLDGDIKAVFSFGLQGKLFKSDKLGFKLKIASLSFKIKDWYYSSDLHKFGFGVCPNRSYKVTVTVKDPKGRLMEGATVKVFEKSNKTEQSETIPKTVDGKTETFLGKGKYFVEISSPGYDSKTKELKIEKKPRSIVLQFDVINDVSMIPIGSVNPQNDYISMNYEKDNSNSVYTNNIRQVEYLENSVAIVTNDNELYVSDRALFPDNGEWGIPLPHKMMDNVEKVALSRTSYSYYSGISYAVLLTDGSLCTWYQYFDHDKAQDIVSAPKKVMENVKEVSFGECHFAALTEDNTLYTWGDNRCGALGIGKRDGYYSTPQKVLKNVKSISAGRDITFAVLENGDLYFAGDRNRLFEGDDMYEREGNTGYSYSKNFTYYMSGVEKVCTDISCLGMTIITQDHKLYSMGHGEYNSSWDNYIEISRYDKIFQLNNIRDAKICGDSCYAINQNGELYIWGSINQNAKPQKVMEHVVSASIDYHSCVAIDKNGIVYHIGTWNPGFGNLWEMATDCKEIYLVNYLRCIGYISLSGDVYMYGYNDFGMLGNGSLEDNQEFECVMHNADHFVKLPNNKMGVITKDYDLYVWGGVFSNDSSAENNDLLKPKKVMSNIYDIQMGYLLTTDYELYSFYFDDRTNEMKKTTRIASDIIQCAGRDSYTKYYIKKNHVLYAKKDYETEKVIAKNVKKAINASGIFGYLTNDDVLYLSENGDEFHKVLEDVRDFSITNEGSLDRVVYSAIKKDGSFWMWGSNDSNRIAQNPFVNGEYIKKYDSPIQIYDHVKSFSADEDGGYYGVVTDDNVAYVFQHPEGICSKYSFQHPTRINMNFYLSRFEQSNDTADLSLEFASEEEIMVDLLSETTEKEVSEKTGVIDYYNLIPDMTYNLYIVEDANSDDVLSGENLYYISQGKTDSKGMLHVSYQTEKDCSRGTAFVVPMSCHQVGEERAEMQASPNELEDEVVLRLSTDAVLPSVDLAIKSNKANSKTVWMKTKKEKDGSYTATLPMSAFEYAKGIYEVKAVAEDFYGNIGDIANSQFEIKKQYCTITYVLNDDALSPATNASQNPTKYLLGGSDIMLGEASRKGYTFLGWYTDKDLTNKISKISSNIEKKVVIYAKWKSENDTNSSGNIDISDNPLGNNNGTENVKQPIETKISISGISKKIAAGKSIQLKAIVMSGNASYKTVIWKSSNKKFATVNSKGKVTLKKAGIGKSVTITATATDGSGKTASYKIKIMKNAVTKVTVKAPKKIVKAGKSLKLITSVKTNGKNANKVLKWSCSNTKYATVNNKGVIKTKKAGKGKTVKVTAMATDGSGKKATVKIKIQ